MTARIRVLVVEDEAITRLDMVASLESAGITVVADVGSVARATEALASQDVDGIVTDLNLGSGGDGLDLVQDAWVRHGVPSIVLTAYSDEGTLTRIAASPAFGYLSKPFSTPDLVAAIHLMVTRARLEKRIEEREAMLSSLLESLSSAIILTDDAGRILYHNDRASRYFGQSIQRGADIARSLPAAAQQLPFGGVIHWNDDDGLLIELRRAPLTNAAGGLDGTVYVAENIATRVATEDALLEAEQRVQLAMRMEATGRLAAGLAHDFNNLMTVIVGYTRLAVDLAARLEGEERLQQYLDGILESALGSAELSRRLLSYTRTGPGKPETLDVPELLAEIEMMVVGLVPEDVTLHYRVSADGARIFVDRRRFEQVIVNLVVNARDAMPSGGDLSISAIVVESDVTIATATRSLPPGTYLVLTVADTGHGIAVEHIPHIFEPFYTTKGSDLGSGLGLAGVYSTTVDLGGAIDVASRIEAGTTFTVYVPCSPQEPSLRAPAGA